MRTAIFDIDGTLANIEHRRHYVMNKPKNWKAFNSTMHLDTPYPEIVELAAFYKEKDGIILIASGREETSRDVTEEWLYNHGVVYHELYMRPKGDYRPDNLVKSDILDQILANGYDPYIVFDDRQQVVDMWRSRGLRCLQVAPGDF